jgi:hypothetical protein
MYLHGKNHRYTTVTGGVNWVLLLLLLLLMVMMMHGCTLPKSTLRGTPR